MIADTNISDVQLIIGFVVAGVVAIIGALAAAWVKIAAAQRASKKQIDTIEHNTNSELTAQKAIVATQDERIAGLEKALEVKEIRIGEQKAEIAAAKVPVVAEVAK